jgi:phosphoglycolate phosphatase
MCEVKPPEHAGLILFDIDGTLVLTGGAGRRALDRAFEELYGVSRAFASIELPGRTDPLIVRDALDAHRVGNDDHDSGRFHEAYVVALVHEIQRDVTGKRVLPGVVPLLEALASRHDRILALLTGNFESSARVKLEHFGLWRYFGWGAFGDDAPDRNGLVPIALKRAVERGHPPVAPRQVVVIGDTPRDVECAKAGGARSIGVGTGSASAALLRDAGADVVLDDLSATVRVMEAIDRLVGKSAD